jgi:hypothetical protein
MRQFLESIRKKTSGGEDAASTADQKEQGSSDALILGIN